MKRNIFLLTLSAIIITSMIVTDSQAKLLIELKTGPETTRAGALDFFGLAAEEYREQDLLSSVSMGVLMANFLGISLEGVFRSPRYINETFSGTSFDTGYANIFFDIFFFRAGLGADLLTITDDERKLKTFVAFIMKLKRFAFIVQATGYGTYILPRDVSFGNNISLQVGFSLMFGGNSKEKWAPSDDEEWREFWEKRLRSSMGEEY